MSTTIPFQCTCGQKLLARADQAGKPVRCPTCTKKVTAPTEAEFWTTLSRDERNRWIELNVMRKDVPAEWDDQILESIEQLQWVWNNNFLVVCIGTHVARFDRSFGTSIEAAAPKIWRARFNQPWQEALEEHVDQSREPLDWCGSNELAVRLTEWLQQQRKWDSTLSLVTVGNSVAAFWSATFRTGGAVVGFAKSNELGEAVAQAAYLATQRETRARAAVRT